ncbi:hypothetical protein PIB30_064324 [Stylosanthes scabra]|uniref:Uncharacterized protein n=1 Tax=Stylosanthes scabra TaxID=79078 RepID=A0ABU6ULN9_9FABA|nr:hypothetical protein [Stylosanthes scabra]
MPVPGPMHPPPRTPMIDARRYRNLFPRRRVAPPTPPPSDDEPSEDGDGDDREESQSVSDASLSSQDVSSDGALLLSWSASLTLRSSVPNLRRPRTLVAPPSTTSSVWTLYRRRPERRLLRPLHGRCSVAPSFVLRHREVRPSRSLAPLALFSPSFGLLSVNPSPSTRRRVSRSSENTLALSFLLGPRVLFREPPPSFSPNPSRRRSPSWGLSSSPAS